MRLAHLSDFHFTELTWNPLRLLSKRVLGNLNWLISRKNQFNRSLSQSLPSLLQELGVDCVLMGGDFTTTAMREEFALAKSYVEQFPMRWFATAGNHDHYTYHSYRTRRFYESLGHGQDQWLYGSLAKERIEAHRLMPGWTLIILDTARPTHFLSSRGLFSKALENKLCDCLASLGAHER
ncbi:MAG: hypothetical protein RL235_393, partial [Chlamydiota bacterium]